MAKSKTYGIYAVSRADGTGKTELVENSMEDAIKRYARYYGEPGKSLKGVIGYPYLRIRPVGMI